MPNYPKDNALRVLEGGGHRTKEELQRRNFPIPTAAPHRPAGLDKVSRRYWGKYVSLYRVQDGDVPAFVYLCELASEIEELKAVLRDEGRFFLKITVDGAGVEHQEKKSHPAFTQLIKLRTEKRILEKDFRLRMVTTTTKKDDLEEMIR